MIKVEGHEHLFRDEETGAIVNTDMKQEISEIKEMLAKITSKL